MNLVTPLPPIEVKATEAKTASLLQWLTLERLLYGLLLLVAAFLRFYNLAQTPLTMLEASNAWPAWLVAADVSAPVAAIPTSPLLYTLHWLLFGLAGGGDSLARALPALAGVALVLAIWWLRAWLGRSTALIAALLIVVDPWLVAFSRLADGASLSILLGMLVLVGIVRGAGGKGQWPAWWMICVGLLLVSGTLAWSWLPVLLLAWWLWRPEHLPVGTLLLDPLATPQALLEDGPEQLVPEQLSSDEPENKPAASMLNGISERWPLILVALAALLGATGWLTRLEGLGYISTSLTTWLSGIAGGTSMSYPFNWPFLRLLADQPLLLIFGFLGLAQLWLRPSQVVRTPHSTLRIPHSALRIFLTLWLVWGILLILVPGRNPLALPMVGLPLLLAAALLGARLWSQLTVGDQWREAWLLVAVLSVLLVGCLFWATALVSRAQFDVNFVRPLFILAGLMIMLVVLYALWLGAQPARNLVGLFVLVLLLLATLSSNWRLNQRLEGNERDGLFAEITDADVRRLAVDVATISAQRKGDAGQMAVLVKMGAAPDPVLGWYLRDMRNLQWVLAPQVTDTANPPLVVANEQAGESASLAQNYLGSRYMVRSRWLPTTLSAAELAPDADFNTRWSRRLQPLLRWLLYRKINPLPPTENVVLWAPPGE